MPLWTMFGVAAFTIISLTLTEVGVRLSWAVGIALVLSSLIAWVVSLVDIAAIWVV